MIRQLITTSYRYLGFRMAALFVLLAVAGILEGMGLTMLFPLLAQLGLSDGTAAQGPLRHIIPALEWVGIPFDFNSLLLATLALLSLQVFFSFARDYSASNCKTLLTRGWQNTLLGTFLAAKWEFFVRERSADRVNSIMVDAQRISAAFYLLVDIAIACMFIVVYAVISIFSSWQMVLLLMTFGFALFLIIRPLRRKTQRIGNMVTEASSDLQHCTTEFMQNAKLLKVTATESAARDAFAAITERYRKIMLGSAIQPSIILYIYTLSGYVLLTGCLWFATTQIKLDSATTLISIYVFLRLYVQISNLQQKWQLFQLSAPALPAVMKHLDRAQALSEGQARIPREQAAEIPDTAAAVECRDVVVNYGEVRALDKVSFSLEPGKVIGITGASGAGKSTLVDVLAGLVSPDSGTVLVNGTPLSELPLSRWRRNIGYVGQQTMLLNGTVAENLSWGHQASREDIAAAAKLANAHDFIVRLPEGYDTYIGEKGGLLSGGQMQRLGLARALVGKKSLLILDESTSALDAESESHILGALGELRENMTIIMIAHKFTTLAICDTILLLENGKITEEGTWQSLSEDDGAFRRLKDLQETPR